MNAGKEPNLALCPAEKQQITDDFLVSVGLAPVDVPASWSNALQIKSIVCHLDNNGLFALELRLTRPQGQILDGFAIIMISRNEPGAAEARVRHIESLAQNMEKHGLNAYNPEVISLGPNVSAALPTELSDLADLSGQQVTIGSIERVG